MKELEDHAWFPARLRNFQTDFIGYAVVLMRTYAPFTRYVKMLPARPLTDLCSGSGEPAVSIFRASECFTSLELTDKYSRAFPFTDPLITYDIESRDVFSTKFSAMSYYTMFNAFHHFSDTDKVMLAKKLSASGATGFFVEILEPTLLCFLRVLLMTTLGTLLLTPFIRPFSLSRLFFTYIIPVNVITISFDGLVSVCKSRSVRQYRKLFPGQEDRITVKRLGNCINAITVIEINPVS